MHLTMQVENEFELIMKKANLFRSFNLDWTQKWVPAIVAYARHSKRKEIAKLVQELDRCLEGAFTLNNYIILINYVSYRRGK